MAGIAACSLAFDVGRIYWVGELLDGAIALAIHECISLTIYIMCGFWIGATFANNCFRHGDGRPLGNSNIILGPALLLMAHELFITAETTLYMLDQLPWTWFIVLLSCSSMVLLLAAPFALFSLYRWIRDPANVLQVEFVDAARTRIHAMIDHEASEQGIELDDELPAALDNLQVNRVRVLSLDSPSPANTTTTTTFSTASPMPSFGAATTMTLADSEDILGFEELAVDRLDLGGGETTIGDLRQVEDTPTSAASSSSSSSSSRPNYLSGGHVDVSDTQGFNYMDDFEDLLSTKQQRTRSVSTTRK
jgi:hypothetical protein